MTFWSACVYPADACAAVQCSCPSDCCWSVYLVVFMQKVGAAWHCHNVVLTQCFKAAPNTRGQQAECHL